MTIDELIEEAAKLGGWEAMEPYRDAIRRTDEHGMECPITAVANHHGFGPFALCDFDDAARAIGFRSWSRVVGAADNKGFAKLRAKMLRAFGLEAA